MLNAELKSKVNQLWDKFWSGGLTNPFQLIEQMFCYWFTSYRESFGRRSSIVTSTNINPMKNLIIM